MQRRRNGTETVDEPGDGARGTGPRHSGRGVQAGRPSGDRHGRRRPDFGNGERSEPSTLYAALDLGTNNCRLLVAEPTRRAFRVVDSFSRIVRLGEGVSRNGRLGDEGMRRAIEALGVCRDKMAARGVTRRRLIATEACRIAENGGDFIARVEERTGLELEIVNRETEARLAVAGCASLVDPVARGVIIFDIGGGSTELVWVDLAVDPADDGEHRGTPAVQDRISAWTSLPFGVVTIAERFGGIDVDQARFEEMVAHVREALQGFPGRDAVSAALGDGGVHLLGTSGTVTTICGVHLDLDRYDRRRVDGTWMQNDDVVAVTDRLIAMSYEERVRNPCIGSDRADFVLAGCAIFEGIRREWPCERVRVADRGLREGMLLTLMSEDGVWRRRHRGWRRRGGNGGGRE